MVGEFRAEECLDLPFAFHVGLPPVGYAYCPAESSLVLAAPLTTTAVATCAQAIIKETGESVEGSTTSTFPVAAAPTCEIAFRTSSSVPSAIRQRCVQPVP